MIRKIALLGDNLRATLAIAESVVKSGFECHVIGWWGLPLGKSKWISKYHNIERWDLNLHQKKNEFEDILASENFFAIIPINDDALEIGHLFSKEILRQTKMVGFPTLSQWKYAQDKNLTLSLFETIGSHGPKSKLISDNVSLDGITASLEFPIVVKPISSRYLVDSEIKTFTVQIVNNEQDWHQKKLSFTFPLLIQEFIEGPEYGFNFYAEGGIILSYYVDEVIHSSFGTEASYRKIADLNDKTEKHIFKIVSSAIKRIEWDGVGMFDFKYFDGQFYVIELNGRFWASIRLGVFAGVDIPKLFIRRKLIGNQENVFITQKASLKRLRNVTNELKYALTLIRGKKVVQFFRWSLSLIKVLSPSEQIEDSFFKDPRLKFAILKWRLNLFFS